MYNRKGTILYMFYIIYAHKKSSFIKQNLKASLVLKSSLEYFESVIELKDVNNSNCC